MARPTRILMVRAASASEEQRAAALAGAISFFAAAGVSPYDAAMQDIYCRNKALLVSDFVIDDQLVELWRSAQSMVRDRCGPDARLLFEAVLYFGRPSTLRVVADGASSDDLRRGLEAAVAVIPAERIVMTMTAQWTRESLGDSGDYATTVPEEALADSEALAAAERATRTICGPTARFEFD